MPGAIGALTPVGAAILLPLSAGANAAFGAHSGLAFDTVRTAREITAAVSEYAASHGLLPPERAVEPKRKGRVRLPWAPKSIQPQQSLEDQAFLDSSPN